MPTWLSDALPLVQAATSVVMALIWLVYLQLIVLGLRRQWRSALSINRGGGIGLDAHLLLTNLGSEPIYVRDVLMTVTTGDGQVDAFLTDRLEYGADELSDPLKGTLQGPLDSGAYTSLGTVTEVFDRARMQRGWDGSGDIERVEFIVLAVGRKASGARKRYSVIMGDDGVRHLRPVQRETEHLSPRTCRRIDSRFGMDV